MKKHLILIVLLLLFSKFVSGQFSLEIEITGLKNDSGLVLLQLFDENEKVINQARSIIKENKSIITFENLKPGKYAFRFFHDENLSGIMETNGLGIPEEGYGFSNNASGQFGPKPFKEWLFEIKEDKKLAVKIKYWQD
jgi:uncharacterized protein (DUF2141 family)